MVIEPEIYDMGDGFYGHVYSIDNLRLELVVSPAKKYVAEVMLFSAGVGDAREKELWYATMDEEFGWKNRKTVSGYEAGLEVYWCG